MSQQTLKANEARSRWREIVDGVLVGGDVVIERYGKPTVAVIPYDDYLALQEELEDLRAARRAEAALQAWERDHSRARPYSEVRREMVEEGLLDG